MSHAEETRSLWEMIGREEELYHRWSSLFGALVGDAATAEGLCELGMKLVRRETARPEELRGQFASILAAGNGVSAAWRLARRKPA